MTKTKKLHRNVATRCNCNQRWPQTERRRRFSLPPLAMQPTFKAVEDVRFCTQWCNKPKRGSRRKISKFDSINSHSAQLECDSHSKPSVFVCFQAVSGSPSSSCRHFWGCGGREPVHTNPPTLHTPGGRELDEKAGYVTCSQVYTQSPWAYKGERFPKMPCHVIQSLLPVVLVSCDQNAISNQHLMEILIVSLNILLYVPFMW